MNHQLALLLLAGMALATPSGRAACVYYTDQPAGATGAVLSLAPDGSTQQLVIAVAGTPDLRGIAWHRASGRVFVLGIEYALATHPRSDSDVPLLTLEGAALRFTRRLEAQINYHVEVSMDLETWHFNGDNTALVWTSEESPTPLGSELESARVVAGPALSGASPVFFRVRVVTGAGRRLRRSGWGWLGGPWIRSRRGQNWIWSP